MVGHTAWGGLAESWPITLPSLHGGEGSSFSGNAPPDDTVNSESLVCIKPGDSGVVIRYEVDEFTCIWSAECFIAQSHIYPGLIGKVSILTHSHPNQAGMITPFWTRQLKTLSMVFILSFWTPHWHARTGCILWWGWCHVFSVCYTWLVLFLILLDHSLFPASNLISYGARLGVCFCLCHK